MKIFIKEMNLQFETVTSIMRKILAGKFQRNARFFQPMEFWVIF